MSSKEQHGPDCNCSQCTLGEEEMIVDLTNSVAKDEVFALNEKTHQSCQKIFKPKEEMLNKTDFCESNDGDPDLVIYIPFHAQVSIKSMRLIGGENGTSPAKIKLFVNKKEDNVDFDLKDATPEQEIDCVENPDGSLPYFLKSNKFHSVWSITLVVMLNYQGDNSKIYYIGFEGTASHKRKKFKLEVGDSTKHTQKIAPTQETSINDNLIYG